MLRRDSTDTDRDTGKGEYEREWTGKVGVTEKNTKSLCSDKGRVPRHVNDKKDMSTRRGFYRRSKGGGSEVGSKGKSIV